MKQHFQKFMKRLRVHLTREVGISRIKFFGCGEYGAARGRPHYHAVIFGFDFPDRVQVGNNPGAPDPLFDSELLRKLWGKGIVRVGTLTGRSAKYVARYTAKKQEEELEQLQVVEEDPRHAVGKLPPFLLCSKSLGARWVDKFMGDVYPSDGVLDEESHVVVQVPRYYDKLLERRDPKLYKEVKLSRVFRERNMEDMTPERLHVREEVVKRRLKALRRSNSETTGNQRA